MAMPGPRASPAAGCVSGPAGHGAGWKRKVALAAVLLLLVGIASCPSANRCGAGEIIPLDRRR